MKHSTFELVSMPLRLREIIREECEILTDIEFNALPRSRSFDRIIVTGGGSGAGDGLENIAIQIVAQKDNINALQAKLRTARAKLIGMLKYLISLDEIDRDTAKLMKFYYIDGRSIAEIAKELHISCSTAYRRQRSGIAAIDKHIDTYPGQIVPKRPIEEVQT